MAGRDGGTWGSAQALVILVGMLLTEHLLSHPEVTSHLQVETALWCRTGVALWVAEAVVHDAHRLCNNADATLLTGVVLGDSTPGRCWFWGGGFGGEPWEPHSCLLLIGLQNLL